jgi:hypothetical protein
MNQRPLGATGFDIAPLVLGGNVFGWTADERTSHAMLDRFVDAGLNAIKHRSTPLMHVEGRPPRAAAEAPRA